MSATTALLALLLVLASALCGVAIWALFESVKTARSARQLADDLDSRLVPLLDKADVTVDAMNAELLRIDQIVTRVDEVTERVSDTSRAVQGVANAPAEMVNDLADRVRRAWKNRKQPSPGETAAPTSESQDTDGPVGDYFSEETASSQDADPSEDTVAWQDADPSEDTAPSVGGEL